jgi:phosphate transport system substrate-binding protein
LKLVDMIVSQAAAAAVLIACSIACSRAQDRPVVRVTGSDTMVNLVQAWAEDYREVAPPVSVQVAGGGSGVGIAGLIDGTLDIAAASREMRAAERQRAKLRYGAEPSEFSAALDALAVYVNETAPLDSISIEELAGIYGERGGIAGWSQLGIRHSACPSDQIIRVGRQNNSGTFAYFRDVVLGPTREFKLGSIDQSGSKDVVALVSKTPCAIGYSGAAFVAAGAKILGISIRHGERAVKPSAETVLDGSYPMARRLYLYTPAEPTGHVKAFLDWALGSDGQRIVRNLGLVPVPGPRQSPSTGRGH